jgi:4-cresol dehydrogenase (hydroxylating)
VRFPPQVNDKDFSGALGQFAGAVGKEWVFSDGDELYAYRDPYSVFWDEPEELIPSAVVAPDTVAQVQQIVRIANTYRIPLWTICATTNPNRQPGCVPGLQPCCRE